MKTTKFFLVILIVAFTTTVFSQATNQPDCVKMRLAKAIQNKSICKAMYEQLDMKVVLAADNVCFYWATVRMPDRTIMVYGKYMEWLNFFYEGKIVNPKSSP
jgi:hypothetical protein